MFPGPIIELHISNAHKREALYHNSYVSKVARAIIVGLGTKGYLVAIRAHPLAPINVSPYSKVPTLLPLPRCDGSNATPPKRSLNFGVVSFCKAIHVVPLAVVNGVAAHAKT
jgi:hypothetical protein